MAGFRVTKTDMARVVVQALLNLPALPAVDHPEVVNRVRRGTVESLSRHHAIGGESPQQREGSGAAG